MSDTSSSTTPATTSGSTTAGSAASGSKTSGSKTSGSTTSGSVACDLCEAARLTPWYYEDDVCWVAECEFCSVPMVVWRRHDAYPPDAVKAVLHERLATVVSDHFGFEHWIDDNMRNIPDHYHAHARRRWGNS